MVALLLSNGQIPEAGVQWVTGLIVVLILVGIVLGFIAQIRKIKRDTELDKNRLLKTAKEEAQQEVESAFEFRELKRSIERLRDEFLLMKEQMRKVEEHNISIYRIERKADIAHRRLDVHYKREHNIDCEADYIDYSNGDRE